MPISPRRISKRLLALGALPLVAAGVAGCGGAISGNSVASVAGNQITLRAVNHWMYVAAKQEVASSPGSPVIVPNDPPDFNGCIKQVRTLIPADSKVSAKTLRPECASVFQEYKQEVMTFLIQGYWYQALAYEKGLHVTDAEVNSDFAKLKKQNFPTAAELNSYLQSSGETMADLLFQVRVNDAYVKLAKPFEPPITATRIAAYYAAHKSTFGTKAFANLHLVRTTSQSDAQAAYRALKSGSSWDTVAKRYSSTASGKSNGGLLTNVTNGEEEHIVNKAIFSSKVGEVVGPIHGSFGWYVIELTKLVPATQKSLAKATADIKQLISSQQTQDAETKVDKEAKAAFGKQTLCEATYSITLCANYKAPKTTSSSSTTSGSATSTTKSSTTKSSTTSSSKTGTSTSSKG